MKTSVLAALPLLLLLGAPARSDVGAPAAGGRWTLQFEHGPLKIAMVEDGTGKTSSYHYMTLKVTNGTALPRRWSPLVKALTDTKREYVGVGDPQALEAVRRRERDEKLVCVAETGGPLAPGESRKSVAIFGPVDPLYDVISVRVYGLTNPVTTYKVEIYGERKIIVDSAYWDRNQVVLKALREEAKAAAADKLPTPVVEYQEIRESRYFEMVYERLGDEFRPDDDVIRFLREGWRIDGEPTMLRVIHREP
jgi:hypothetical protein